MKRRVTRWMPGKRPVLRFVMTFVVLVVAINVLLLASVRGSPIILRYLAVNAEAAGAVLQFLGENVFVMDRTIVSPRFSLEVSHGCDAVQPMALFVAATLAAPVRLRRRLLGIVLGIVVLLSVNLARIVSLYYVGVHYPGLFSTIHVEVWGAGFIFLTMALWIAWGVWATRRPEPRPDNGATERTSLA